jgi:exopolyphosphatase/guanosine-5'-triphosphate,3'-diphosphate pyrophosphatase
MGRFYCRPGSDKVILDSTGLRPGPRNGPVAIIDIGTNSMLFLLAERDGTVVRPIRQEIRTTRLGRGLASSGRIGKEEIGRTAAVLSEWKELALATGAGTPVCTGTRVFRAAANREEVLNTLFLETGLKIEVLPEQDEAAWSYIGAKQGPAGAGRAVVMDIGGGSTEWAAGDGPVIRMGRSVPIGAVTLTEKHMAGDPPSDADLAAMADEIRTAFAPDIPMQDPSVPFVCVGGTATTLAGLELGLDRYDAAAVDGTVLDRSVVKAWAKKLAGRSLAVRREMVRIDPDRSDILPAGLFILLTWMESAGIPSVRVSDRGLRFGIAARELGLAEPAHITLRNH